MYQDIKDKVALITGGARGIGANIALQLGHAGAKVWICDIDEDGARNLLEKMQGQGVSVDFIQSDLSRPDAPKKMIQQVVRESERIDILVNNAKAGARTSLFTETPESWDYSFSVLMRLPFFASQEAIKNMKESGGGVIINIASVAATHACHESPAYHAAKAGVLQMTRYLAKQGGKFGVRVNCISPGFIVRDEHRERFESEGSEAYRSIANYVHPAGRVGSSDEVADVVMFLASDKSSFISGQNIVVDGGLTSQEPFDLVVKHAQPTGNS